MRNVRLHVDDGIILDVSYLRGEMISTTAGPPVFDDQRSYVLHVSTGEIAMDMSSLTTLMNDHVFAYDGAPLSDISMEIDEGELKQKGKLHKGIVVPISMKARVAATSDGRMRLATRKVSVVGVPAKGLMGVFGLELADVVKLKQDRGMEIDENDIIIDPGRLLPAPEMRGHLVRVQIAGGKLRHIYAPANGKRAAKLSPPDPSSRNYIYFSGSDIRFGKLTMHGADLQLIDSDPKDVFDFSPAGYKVQLVAGYSKNTPSGGLKTYMPDITDLGRKNLPDVRH